MKTSPIKYNGSDKSTEKIKGSMSRTSGVARGMSSNERIGRQRQAAAAKPLVRDKYNPSVDLGQTALDWIGAGVNKNTGKFEVDPVGLAMNFLPIGELGKLGKLGKITKALTPKAARIESAAARIASGARKAKYARNEIAAATHSRAMLAGDAIRQAGSDAYADYEKMNRRVGTAATEAWGGSSNAWRQRAMDSAGRIADKAGVAAHKAQLAANRTKNLSDLNFATNEIKGRLSRIKRAKYK
jgi:hypothetical protein